MLFSRHAAVLCCGLLALCLVSCGNSPKTCDKPQIKRQVLLLCDEDNLSDLVHDFADAVSFGKIKISGFEKINESIYNLLIIPESFNEKQRVSAWALIMLSDVCNNIDYKNDRQMRMDFLKGCAMHLEECEPYFVTPNYKNVFTDKLMTKLFDAFMEFCDNAAVERVKFVEWTKNPLFAPDGASDRGSYKCYMVVYKVDGREVYGYLNEYSNSKYNEIDYCDYTY